jgi:hypothetical protein
MSCPVALQLPHFLSLAWLCRGDYARGGYRMLSLVDATGRRTAACCLRNSLYLMPAGLLAYQLGVASSWFATEAGIMAGGLLASVMGQSPTAAKAPCVVHLEQRCVQRHSKMLSTVAHLTRYNCSGGRVVELHPS